MAYVYNQNQDEQQSQGSNIFAPQGQDGQQQGQQGVEKTAPSGTLTAGVGAPLHGQYRGTQRTGQEISQQAGQQRQARLPLQEIYKRNQPAQVGVPDFSKTMQQIRGAQESAQAQADAYKTAQLNRFTKLSEEDIKGAAEGTQEATNKAASAILPQQLTADEFKLQGADLPTGLESQLKTPGGLQDLIRKQAPVAASKGELNLDVALLQRSPEFQQTRDQLIASAKAAQEQRQKLLEDTQSEAQKALDPKGEAATAVRDSNLAALKKYADETLLEPGKAALQSERDKQANLQKQIEDYQKGLAPMPDILKQALQEQAMQLASPADIQKRQFLEQYLAAPQQKSTFDPYLQRLQGLEMASGLEASPLTGTPFNTWLGGYESAPDVQMRKSLSVSGVPESAQASQYLNPEQFAKFQRIQSMLGTPATATPELKQTAPQIQVNKEALTPYLQRASDWYQQTQSKLQPLSSAKQTLSAIDSKIANQSGRSEKNLMGNKGSEFYNQFQKSTQGLSSVAKAALALSLQYQHSPDAMTSILAPYNAKGPNFAEAARQFGVSEERVRKAYGALG